MNVTQTTSKAILNWADFNIANGYTVNFVQPSQTASVLNKIWSADPSVIAGALKANGQVYLYNQNGILFDKGAQINVGSLTASTLGFAPVNGDPDALFKNGLLSNNANATTPGTLPAVFTSCTGSPCTTTPGAVTVNSGATLTTADGGRIMLIGSAVTNNGKIVTPDGQAVLGAGSQVYLAASSDPALRGLLIEVNAAGTSGTATNNGVITADRGNITVAGLVVNQAGQMTATTSVSANGSIYLVAGDTSSQTSGAFVDSAAVGFGHILPNNGGTVTLKPGSVTEVLPDSTDTGTISEQNLATGSFVPSQIGIVGQTVAMVGNASIHAPGGAVTLSAATNPAVQFPAAAANQSVEDGGRIYLDSNSSIDVSGLQNVAVPVTQNLLAVTLEGTDLADDPQLRSGFLHGQQVVVNANQGSLLFNVTPYKGNISIGIDQVLTSAGSISLHSDGDVIANAGSTLNVSGGSVAYQGGYGFSTTKLVGANGQVYDIGSAPATLQYTGIANSYSYTDPTWGTKTSASAQTYYSGYTQGTNAGSVTVEGAQIYLGGSLQAATIAGPYQRGATSPTSLPAGGQLTIGCNCTNLDYGAPAVVFLDNATAALPSNFNYLDPNSTLPSVLQSVTEISPAALAQVGFNRISIFSNGAVTLPQGVNMTLAPGGSLSILSDQLIDIAGTIRAPGATISLTTSVSRSVGDMHNVTIDSGGLIDTSGTWVNDSPLVTATPGNGPIETSGGTIALSAYGNVILQSDSRLDVSGGGWVSSTNALTKGNAGKVSLNSAFQVGTDAFTGAVKIAPGAELLGNSLTPGGGGTLSITSGSVTLGWVSADTPGELLLTPTFFSGKGFGTYNITGANGLSVGSAAAGSPSVVINPIEENLVFTGNSLLRPTGTALASFTELTTLPPSQRVAANLSLTTTATQAVPGIPDEGNLYVASNASIVTDPGGSVSLAAKSNTGSITLLGSILAPAGQITLQLANPLAQPLTPSGFGYEANQVILLGPNASLAAPAFALVDTLDPLGYREGTVLAGGSVSLIANRGYVVTDAGSVIDVSGAATVLDIVTGKGVIPTPVAGNAGSITIDAREGLVLQGALRGEAAQLNGVAVPGAGGGSLSIGLDLFDYQSTLLTDLGGVSVGALYSLAPRTLTLTDQPAVQFPTSGVATVGEQSLLSGGFDNIQLKSADVIAIDGAVALSTKASITLDAPLLQANAGASLQLNSAHVSLGNYYNQSDYFDTPPNGPVNPNATAVLGANARCFVQCGTLSVQAQLIDVRGVGGWSGFSTENLNSSGDIRFGSGQIVINTPPAALGAPDDVSTAGFRSGLFASGTVNLTSQQAYPTTYTDFTLAAGSAVNILAAAGAAATPLSAGGSITINAPTINQSGVLRAPLGEITLSGTTVALESGSVTSVSANGVTIPYGSTQNSDQWTYSPASGYTEIVKAPVAKTINLDGDSVFVQKGATLDLSGGGDLLASEWIAGPGGSTDVLNPQSVANQAGIKPYQYAIVPGLGSQFAPVDAQFAQQATSSAYQTIYLSGVPGLAAGYYALLPARYALLPGAFAIRVVQPNSDVAAGSVARQSSGAYVVAGKLGTAGTDIIDSRTSTVLVAPSSVVQTQSQYTETSGNVFFANAAAATQTATPALPADAGSLQLAATATLALNGSIDFASGSYTTTNSAGTSTVVKGAGGFVSVQAPDIVVVDAATSLTGLPTDALKLDAQSLDNLGAATLILGASARQTAAGEQINVGSTQTIELANSTVALAGPDVILAAQDNVMLDAGAQISAKGTLNRSPTTLVVNGAGALLRATSGSLASVEVEPNTSSDYLAQNPAGHLSVGSAVSLAATGSVLLYATGGTTADSSAAIVAPALGIYSSRVSLGDVPTGTNAPGGLNLTGQLLTTLTNATQLTIGSTSTIDFYGTVGLGTTGTLQNLTLDAAGLDGYDTLAAKSNVTLQAGSILLENSAGVTPTYNNGVSPTGSGSLTLIATAANSTQSGQITLGSGAKTISGFGAGVALDTAGNILTQGTGASLCVPSCGTGGAPVNLSLTSAALTAAAGSDQTISASGLVSLAQAGSPASASAAPLGGKLVINGGTGINQSGTINLPGGIIELNAMTGDVVLGNGSVTSAAGAVRSFTVTDSVAAGGQISLSAATGNVTLAPGSTVNVAGATSADGKESGAAGSLSVFAPTGTFAFAGSTLEGSAATGQLQGGFSLDVGSGLAGSGFAALTDALQGGGFTGDLSFRTRTDAGVTIANTASYPNGIVAASFALSADQGSIDVQGEINTSGGNALNTGGGAIALFAQNNLTLESSAQLLANATSGGPAGINGAALTTRGGDVTLGTQSGSLILNGGKVSLLGSSGSASDGTLTLRAPRTADQLGVNIQLPTTGTVEVDTHNPIIVEGYQCYGPCTAAARAQPVSNIVLGDPGLGSLDITLSGTPYGDALTFVGNGNGALLATSLAKGFSNDLGASAPVQVQVRAGVEIDSTGDITVGDANTPVWNLEAWNLALGTPVNVTLRAGGNLVFAASLSDGFTPRGARPIQQWTFGDTSAANNDSASYRLAAGADLTAVNPLAVIKQTPVVDSSGIVSGTGNVVLTPGRLIRTGDGNIQIAAGGNVLLGYTADPTGTFTESDPLTTTAIYTAGVASILSPTALPFSAPASNVNVPSYTTQGGDVTVSAANDIRSAPGAEVPSDWIWRQGSANTDGTIGQNTSWWVEIGTFQGIGALGGGNVTLDAGRDIVDVTAAIPTTGRLLGAQGQSPTLNNLVLTGGGTLTVRAAGNISSGVYEDDWGNALLTAGGALNATATLVQEVPATASAPGVDPSAVIYPLLFTGSGDFNVNARTDATINFVGSSTAIPEDMANSKANSKVSSAFFNYSPSSALTLQSTGGNVVLDNDVTALPMSLLNPSGNGNSGLPAVYSNGPVTIYPPTLNVVAFSGDVAILGEPVPVNLFPSASGQLNLLAQGYITGSTSRDPDSTFGVTMYESDPLQWANVLIPQLAGVIPDRGGQLPVTPLHEADSQPVNIVAETGSIYSGTLNLPKAANLVAGGDIDALTLNGKNLSASDVTLVAAGGNITFTTPTAPITNALQANSEGISLAGPGYLEVLAGGTLNLGDGNGILTSGSLTDSRLAPNSASVVAGAGFGTNASGGLRLPAVAPFISTYLAPDKSGAASAYAPDLIAYMQSLDPTTYTSATYATALSGFESLNFQHQLPLLSQVLMNELNETGLAHTKSGASYDRGYNAINILFPTKDAAGNALAYKGDIDLFFSQIKTDQGGDINLLAPGGSVIVGVPNPPASLASVKNTGGISAAANLGLLVLASGTIKGFADQSFEVNQSRILTLQGGDIILWASNGDIDAGKGAKSASGASPPVIQTDSSGNVFVNPIGDVAGSGIGQLLTGPGETAGLVDLIAPKGTVNAGDAGIRVAGDLNIAALQVIGANNITVGGTATGVPVSDAGALSGALSGANSLGDAAKSAVDQLSQNLNAAANFQQLSESLQPTFVVVKMFCLGVDCQLH
jgi:filamentous hemagglutinin family protein